MYRIVLLPQWKIHLVILIIHLHFISKGENSFKRLRINIIKIINDSLNGDNNEWKSYKLKRIINKKIIYYSKKLSIEYLI